MTLVKWKRPSANGHTNNQLIYTSPLSEFFGNFFSEDLLTKEYAQFVPAVNLSEEDRQYYLELSAPGFEKTDFKIELNEKVLGISGKHRIEKETREKTYSRKEFNYGSFQRFFSLPEEINQEDINAVYENGILKITLPKKEENKKMPKEIKIS